MEISSILILYHCCVCAVKNSWWWTEELSETCNVSFQNKFNKLVHLVGFILKLLFPLFSFRYSFSKHLAYLCHLIYQFSINLLKPPGHIMHQKFITFNNCTLCPHCIYVFCIYLRIKSDLCHLQHKLIVFITGMKSVYSAVRTGSLNKAVCASSLKG
jgi:hypothetical protein